jgi:PadR family transcriptional regulator, regulatory protein PadR
MINLNKCPCSGKTLARLIQPAVMAVLANEPLHGYVIVQRLTGMTMFCDHGPDITGVYRLLKNMEKNGYVTSTWELAISGPAKRRYALTPDGRTCLTRWIATLRTYRDAVSNLLDTAASSGAAKSRRGGKRKAPTPKGRTDEG